MIVLVLETVPTSLRGELTRWLLEPKAGVFVGRVSGMVRDRLWDKVCDAIAGGGAILIHGADCEQQFGLRIWGNTSRRPTDREGLTLMTTTGP